MAYVPPHERLSKDSEKALESVVPNFKRNLTLRNSKSSFGNPQKIKYADNVVRRWLPVGILSSVHLEELLIEPYELEKRLILVKSGQLSENDEMKGKPWVFIASNIFESLLSAFEVLKNETKCPHIDKVKPTLVVRIGKIQFRGSRWMSLDSVRKGPLSETILTKLQRSCDTNVPTTYLESILADIESLGFRFQEVKDTYQVKLYDKTRPDAIISCKCNKKEDQTLSFNKAELKPVRQLIVDISCLDKGRDFSLLLCEKTILTNLSDDEIHGIKEVIGSAVLDPTVKGGLRWPVGQVTYGDRYIVCGAWHTTATTYSCPSLTLKVRDADRFDFHAGTGVTSKEAAFKLKGLTSKLQEEKVDETLVFEMLKDNLKLIWNHFLSTE